MDSLTKKPVRKEAKQFVDSFRREFNAAVQAARAPSAVGDPMDDSPDPVWFKQGRYVCGIIEVEIAEHPLVVANTTKRMLVRLDNATQNFITSIMIPALELQVEQKPEVPTTTEVDSSSDTKSKTAFQLDVSFTPNLRDKVMWSVTQHAWKVLLKKPTEEARVCWGVDPRLNAADYEEQKMAMYWDACREWNRCDGTKRHDIPLPSVVCQGKTSTSPSHV